MSNPSGSRTRSGRSRSNQDPRQQLNERVQNYFGDAKEVLKVDCRKTVQTPHAQRWRCTFLLQEVPMGESEDARNQKLAKKDAAEKALRWLEEKGYPRV